VALAKELAVAKDEEVALKRMLPWLSSEFGEELRWLGTRDDNTYCSQLPGERCLLKHLDGEVAGPHTRIAIERTDISSYPNQQKTWAVFREPQKAVRAKQKQVPRGQHVTIAIPEDVAHQGVASKQVRSATPALLHRLDTYLPTLPVDPPKSAVVRGNLLEELTWSFGEIDFQIKRFWFPEAAHLHLVELHDPTGAPTQLDRCVEKALNDKVSDKRKAYQAYKDAGWRTLLVLELEVRVRASTHPTYSGRLPPYPKTP
jgi:hypothetical protein